MSSHLTQEPGSSASDPIELSDSESDNQSDDRPTCHWRTVPHDPASCTRYWDCPSHNTERISTHSPNRYPREGIDAVAGPTPDSTGNAGPSVSAAWPQTLGSSSQGLATRAHRLRSPSQVSGSSSQTHGTQSNPVVLSSPSPQPHYRSLLDIGSVGPPNPGSTSRNNSGQASRPPFPPFVLEAQGNPSRAPSSRRSRAEAMAATSPVTLPRWQPDNEVTYCPICHSQFSFLNRKHHCRKCGRVICAACSPHRITIPHQYIVRPPGAPRVYPTGAVSSYGEGGFADFSSIGGGEQVRLCNPCVPDPNYTPPQTQGSIPSHTRSQSNIHQRSDDSTASSSSNRWSSYLGAGPPTEAATRSRSITVGNQATPVPPGFDASRPIARPRMRGRGSSSGVRFADQAEASGSSAPHSRMLPPVPRQRRQIAEEDECPVCHLELPSRNLPDFEAQREAHITACITDHSVFGRTPTGGTGPGSPGGAAASRPRRTLMFPYKATEKDCVDSAECTICLEEFEVGVDMGRLECLCRFHRRCIDAWFKGHPGMCPIHQHGDYMS